MIDELDRQIAWTLAMNCRTSLQDLSNKLGITRTAVKKRIDRLIETGALASFSVRLSHAQAGYDVAFAILKFSEPSTDEYLVEYLSDSEFIGEIARTFDNRALIIFDYPNSTELSRITNSFRKMESVTDVDIMTNLVVDKGGTIELTGIHKKVLRCLLRNARMSISDISKESGLTPRRISKIIHELIDSRAILFTISWVANTAGETTFVSKVHYDASKIEPRDLLKTIYPKMEDSFNYAYISGIEPFILLAFTVDHFSDADRIQKDIMETGFVTTIDSMVTYPGIKPKNPRVTALERLLEES
jgi:DNA-binding Lrp family transcriptional regulator